MENYSFSDLITFSRTTNATLVDGTGNVTYAPNNLFTNSEAFEASSWTKDTATVTANATVAPDGTTTADKAIPNNGADLTSIANGAVRQAVTFPAGATLVFSVFAKEAEFDRIELYFSEGTGTANRATVTYSLVDGSVVTAAAVAGTFTNVSSTSTSVGNGWYRLTLTFTSGTATSARARFAVRDSGTTTGDGTSGIFIWGAQLEQVTYQTTPGTYNSTSPPNLFGFTEEFDNAAWTKTNSTIAANVTVAPDGTLTADKHIPNAGATLGPGASATRVFQTPTLTSDVTYVFSIYAKAGEFDQIEFAVIVTPTATAKFSLTLGTVISGTGASITPVGNGWYRCAVSLTANATAAVQARWSAESSTVSVGDGTSGIFVWGAQLSNSASVDPYVYNPGAAPTSTAYYGPRFDYNPTTLAPLGLLIEEQRVNLLLYSEQFDNAGWVNSFTTVTANVTTSPDGTTNADRLTADGSLNPHDIRQTETFTAAAHTLSVYAKKDTNDFLQLRFGSAAIAGGTGFANFDLNAGTVGTIGAGLSAASITPAGNGWYRCTITGTTAATSTVIGFYIVGSASSTSAQTNTLTTSVFIYGAQLEVGSFPTSYIPTVASTVTRAADTAVMSGSNFSSWYNISEGTIVVNADSFRGTAGSARNFQFDDGTSANNIRAAGASALQVVDATVVQASLGPTPLIPFDGTAYKFASAYKLNDFASVTTGAVATDTSGTVPTAINQLVLGSGSGTNYLNGHIRSITFYPYRLADFQLQALTA